MMPHIPNRPGVLADDPWLNPFAGKLDARQRRAEEKTSQLTGGKESLADFASGHEFFGLHREESGDWIFREWAPNAVRVIIIGDFCNWDRSAGIECQEKEYGIWRGVIPMASFHHGDLYRLHVEWEGGSGDRIPTCARRVVQDAETLLFNAQVWAPS